MYQIPLRNPNDGVIHGYLNLVWSPPAGSRAPLTIYQTTYQALPGTATNPAVRSVAVHVYLDDLYHTDGPFARIDLILPHPGYPNQNPNRRIPIHIYCGSPAMTPIPTTYRPNRSRRTRASRFFGDTSEIQIRAFGRGQGHLVHPAPPGLRLPGRPTTVTDHPAEDQPQGQRNGRESPGFF